LITLECELLADPRTPLAAQPRRASSLGGSPQYALLPVHARVMAQLPSCEASLHALGTGLLVYLLLAALTRVMGSVLDLYAKCLAHLQRSVDMRRVTHQRRRKVRKGGREGGGGGGGGVPKNNAKHLQSSP
jgi:hypothetical protein